MVAVFTGNALGLFDTSLTQVGGGLAGAPGRGRHGVNAMNGNLVLHNVDELLVSRGLSMAAQRTYNSLGETYQTASGATGFEKSVRLDWDLDMVVLTEADGSEIRFANSGSPGGTGAYRSVTGSGAHDTMDWDGTYWVRQDGSTGLREVYLGDQNGGRLHEVRETRTDGSDPARYSVMYTGALVTEVRFHRNGNTGTGNDALLFTYAGGRLTAIESRENGAVRQQTVYEYDGQGRLVSVLHDLTPDALTDDNAWNATASANDGQRYRTQYTYDGTSLRIASVRSSDGQLTSYTYYAGGAVRTVTRGDTNIVDTDGVGETTTFTYAEGQTHVVDSLNRMWTYVFDGQGQLTELHGPARDGLRDVTAYAYDNHGNVASVQTTRGGTLLERKQYSYDGNGNVLSEWDALGNVVERTWTAANQLASLTTFTGIDYDGPGSAYAPTGPLTTRYVYDAQNRLRFTVGPLGEVTQLAYGTSGNAAGLVTESRAYKVTAYAGAVDEWSLASWANLQSANSSITTYTYDQHGRLAKRTEAGEQAGAELATWASTSFTDFVYDAQGMLRQQIVRRGADHTVGAGAFESEVTDYVYDGIGRLLDTISRGKSVTFVPGTTDVATLPDATTLVTRTTYLDSAVQVRVVTDGGATRLETRNAEGNLMSVSEAATGLTTRNTYHHYDSAGQLRATEDAGGGRTYFFYDERGNRNGIVDPTGSVVETEYDSLGRAVRTLTHSERVSTAAWMSGIGASAVFTASFPQRAAAQNGWSEDFADASIAGLATDYIDNPAYTGIKRVNGQLVLQRTDYPTTVFPNAMSASYAVADGPMFRAEVSTGASLTNIYGFFGFWRANVGQIGLVFDSGKIFSYDYGAGVTELLTLTTNTTYVVELHATSEGIDLRVTLKGQDIGTGATFHVDTDPSVWPAVCFNIQSNMYPGASGAALYVDNVSHVRVRAATQTYDQAGRLVRENDGAATKTYEYDAAHRLLRTTLSAPGEASRVARNFYDASNRLIGVLDAEGYLTEHAYDIGGRLVSTTRFYNAAAVEVRAAAGFAGIKFTIATHAQDQVTRNLYDRRDRLVGVLDAEGYLTEYVYDEAGNQRVSRAYAKKMNPGSAASLVSLVTTAMTSPPAEPFRETRSKYNGLGQLITTINHEGTVTNFTYDQAGRLIRSEVAAATTEVRNGLQWFDAFGQLIGELSGEHAVDGSGNPRVTDASTEAAKLTAFTAYGVRHAYDVLGRRIESIDALGHKTWFIYDAAGRNTFTIRGALSGATKNAKGEVTETRYTAFGEIAETLAYTGAINIASPSGHAQAWTAVNALAYVAAVDSRRLYFYDSRGLMVQQVDTESGPTLHRYNRFGELVSTTRTVTSQTTTTTTRGYDRRGLQTTQTDGAGSGVARTTSQAYDAFGRVISAVDGRGVATTFGYDRIGRQVVSTNRATYTGIAGAARTETTSATYDAYSRVLTQTNGVGQATTYAYSDANRTITVTTPDLLVLTTANNRHGQTLTVTAPGGGLTTYEYDRSGRQVKATNPVGNFATSEYDVRGLLVATVANATGNRVEYTYDAAGRVLTRKEDAGTGRLNLLTTWTYDAQGRQVTEKDALNKTTTTSYDREGRVLTVARDSAGLNLRTQYAWDATGNQLSVTEGFGTAEARTVAYAYDAFGRRTGETVAPGTLNLTTTYTYDANDNVVQRVDANGHATLFAYDQSNRLVYTLAPVNPPGDPTPVVAVTRHWYDEAGRLTATRRYANTIELGTAELAGLLSATGGTMLATLGTKVAAVSSDPQDALDFRVYDAGGRLRYTLAMSEATKAFVDEVRYDTRGNGHHQLSYATAVTLSAANLAAFLMQGDVSAATAATQLTTVGNLLAGQASPARESYRVINAAGRERFLITRDDAGRGVVVNKKYDADGNVIATVRHALTVVFNPADDAAAVDAKLVGATAAQQLDTRYAYDRLGRLRFTVDDTGVATETVYDAMSRVVETRQFTVAVAPADYSEATIAAAVGVPAVQAGMRKTVHQYDAAGRLTKVTDALDKFEQFGYDAVGNRISYTDKLLNTWNYVYDAGGRMVEEKAPSVEVFRFSAATGTTLAKAALRVVTKITYDGLGNVLSRTENAGSTVPLVEQRKTTYAYDSRGNQIRTTFPKAWQISESTLQLVDDAPAPTIEVGYDALGRAVMQKDVRGIYSYKVYDKLGRVAHDVDGEGYVTSYEYDDGDRNTKLIRRAAKLAANVPAGRGGAAAITDAQWATAINALAKAGNRVLVTTFDAAGRKKTVESKVHNSTGVESGIDYWDSAGNAQTGGVPTTEFVYDAVGNLVQERVKIDATKWAETWHWYDQRGQRTHTVDPGNYLTKFTYDAVGNEIQRTEYANAITAALAFPTPPATPAAGTAATGFDRTLVSGYDALNRKTSESVVRRYQDAATGNALSGTVLTTYAFDAEDRLTKVTVDGVAAGTVDAVSTTNAYDALGRLTSVTEHARDALKQGWDGAQGLLATANDLSVATMYASVTPYTQMSYDAFGNVVRIYRPVGGLAGVADVNNAANQYTYTRYDYQGRAVVDIDAEGKAVYTRYNAADLATVTFYDLANGVGAATRIKDLYSYDALGRQIEHYECHVVGTTDVADGAEAASYNSFGEIVAKAWIFPDLGTAAKTRDYVYDGAGNLTESDETGATRRYKYNLAGQQVAELRDPTSAAVTKMTLDKLGRATTTTLPAYNDAGTITTVVRVFDRWGNVLRQTDARGLVTDWTYNDRNQALTQKAPSVDVLTTTGTTLTGQRPETQWWYDANGRLIGVRDANGNTDRNLYNLVGQLTQSTDAIGYATRYAYDTLGRQRVQEDALKYQTTRTYDRLDRITAVGDFLLNPAGSARTAQNRETYVLNRNGDRISVKNGENEIQLFNYDPRGLLLRSQSAMGVVKEFGYDYAGNKVLERYAPGTGAQTSQTWLYDVHNRLIDHVDLGGNNFDYAYDSSGRLASETSTQMLFYAEDTDNNGTYNYTMNQALGRTTTYYANGLVKEIRYSPTEYTRYEYDANGNRTLEKTVKTAIAKTLTNPAIPGVNLETRIAYDSHNRIVSITTDDFAQTDFGPRVLTVQYAYDAVGNRRKATATNGYAETSVQEGWYTYDAENRVLIDGGQLYNGQVVYDVPGSDPYSFWAKGALNSYDAVGRLVQRLTPEIDFGNWLDSRATKTDTSYYNQRGERFRASSVTVGAPSVFGPGAVIAEATSTHRFDLAGRMIESVDYFPQGWTAPLKIGSTMYYVPLTNVVKSATTYVYDDDGRATSQTRWGRRDGTTSNGSAAWVVPLGTAPSAIHHTWDATNATGLTKLEETRYITQLTGVSGYDTLGRLVEYRYSRLAPEWNSYNGTADDHVYTHYFSSTFTARDAFLERKTSGTSTNTSYKPTSTESWYDAAGRRHAIEDHTIIKDGPDLHTRRQLVYNGDGQILLRKREYKDGNNWEQGKAEGSGSLDQLQNRWYTRFTQQQWEALGETGREHWYDKQDNARATYVNGQQIASVTEDGFGFQALEFLTGFSNGSLGQGKILVQEGDTLQSLSQRAYGTTTMWYVIADANGLGGASDELPAGITLTLPQVRTASNDAQTFKPYDPSDITGPTTPSLPYIAPPDAGCGTIGMIIMVVVMIVVTIYTAGAAATMFAGGAGAVGGAGAASVGAAALAGGGAIAGTTATLGLGAAMGGAAVGAFVGSVASQAVGSAMGVTSFSWKNAAAAGITAGLTAGVGGLLNGVGQAAEAGKFYKTVDGVRQLTNAGKVLQGMAAYGAGVIGNAAVGNSTGFSWKGVAASAVSAYVGIGVGKGVASLGIDNRFAGDFVHRFAGGVVSGHINKAFGTQDSVNLLNIAADAFGNAVGSAVVRRTELTRKISKALEGVGDQLHDIREQLRARGVPQEEIDAQFPENPRDYIASLRRVRAPGEPRGKVVVGPLIIPGRAATAGSPPPSILEGILSIDAGDSARLAMDTDWGVGVSPEDWAIKTLNPLVKLKLMGGFATGIIGGISDDVVDAYNGLAWVGEGVKDAAIIQARMNYGLFSDETVSGAVVRTNEKIETVTEIIRNAPSIFAQIPQGYVDDLQQDFRSFANNFNDGNYFDSGVGAGLIAYKTVGLVLGGVGAAKAGFAAVKGGFKAAREVLANLRRDRTDGPDGRPGWARSVSAATDELLALTLRGENTDAVAAHLAKAFTHDAPGPNAGRVVLGRWQMKVGGEPAPGFGYVDAARSGGGTYFKSSGSFWEDLQQGLIRSGVDPKLASSQADNIAFAVNEQFILQQAALHKPFHLSNTTMSHARQFFPNSATMREINLLNSDHFRAMGYSRNGNAWTWSKP